MKPSKKRGRRSRKSGLSKIAVFLVCAVLLAVTALMINHFSKKNPIETDGDKSSNKGSTSSKTDPTTTEEPFVLKEVGKINIASMGDLLIHSPVLNAAFNSADKTYNFDNAFSYFKDYASKYDFSVANLEVTLAGNKRQYTGYPIFNCPDDLVDSAKKAGINMLITANNHSYDTGFDGMMRTVDVLREKKMIINGTRKSDDEKRYLVQDINGAKVGMVNYTYETVSSVEGRKALNGILLNKEAGPLINSFDYQSLDGFYADITSDLENMKKDGAKVSLIYLHWGEEYQTSPNQWQKLIAQKICEIGYDVIIGGHPHVVQPLEILTSATGKQTVCLYSMGNALSNQRREYMNLKTGHTEDGMIFETELTLYNDGDVVVSNVNVVPTWVNMHTKGGRRVYSILPLDKNVDWKSKYDLSEATNTKAEESYKRTNEIVKKGLESFKSDFKVVKKVAE